MKNNYPPLTEEQQQKVLATPILTKPYCGRDGGIPTLFLGEIHSPTVALFIRRAVAKAMMEAPHSDVLLDYTMHLHAAVQEFIERLNICDCSPCQANRMIEAAKKEMGLDDEDKATVHKKPGYEPGPGIYA